ncbi:MAG: transglycosylase domain-containing protein, partial [Actinomycetes bacterium]
MVPAATARKPEGSTTQTDSNKTNGGQMASNERGDSVHQDRTSSRGVNTRRRLINYPRSGRRGLKRWIPSWKLTFGSLVALCLLAVAAFSLAVLLTPIPDVNASASSEKTIVYWNDGKTEIGRIGEANRIVIPGSSMPVDLQHAVIATEDKTYYEHGGFDPLALGRAFWNATFNDGATQGASTITQQYAKNAYLTQDRTISRKFRELLLSVKLDSQESKDQILSEYLNTIYFGRGAYGVETASQAYFGKSADKLKLNEAAVLAAVIKGPTDYEPEKHRDRLQVRFDYVLDSMVSQGWLSPADRKKMKLPEFKKYKAAKSSMVGTNGYLLDTVERELIKLGFTQEQLDQGGLRITTTFDKADQEAAVAAVNGSGPGAEAGLRIGLTSVKVDTGEVLAMYGGADYLKNQLSNSDQAIALGGSTFKPFALAAATEDGIKLDSMWDVRSPRTIGGYKLENEGNQSYGQISLLQAIESSVNTVFVDLSVNKLGPEKVKEAAIRAGLPANTIGLVADPTTVLGTAAPTTEEMAGAYATFANEGMRLAPTTIKEVKLNNGGPVYQYTPDPTRAFSPDVANTVNYALQKVVTSGTGYAANSLGRPAAGKTGTTDNN